ncbi:helix-turn-helix domain-containing protein [Clostridium sp. JS66]|uniref:ArsR/SmtB family transcription factor n=1 Tax=Clostridium sp. JS66 TaxID=3064705 RepID=UPI00298E98B3|nr:helix-turn-helix domain-containing protein [Clostridium sp. JS66]WPC43723.1 helix-turn-helix domain-containing protein [Clostridium sp. JS66]
MDTKTTKKENVNSKQLDTLLMQEFFKILTEPIRIELIKYLAINGPSDISTIASNFTQDRSVISKHLKMMNKAGILILTKSSRHSIYQVDGIEILLKMESMVEAMKTLLKYTCKDTFDYLYSKNMNYKNYLKQLEEDAPIK